MKEQEKNLPSVIPKQEEAQKLVDKHRSEHSLIFVRDEDLRTQTMFLPEVVIVNATPEEFHNINNKFMPKRHQTDRIGEAAGIVFLEENCGTRTDKVEGHTVYVGFAQAKKRMPDGTWRNSSVCEYEFDPVKRTEEDVLRDTKGKYKDEKERRLALLNYQKFGRARASTGARLRVIRELTGMPTAIEAKDLKKSMVFCRIALNTDQLLQQPELRDTAVKLALGAKERIYGPNQLEHSPEYEVSENGNGNEASAQEETKTKVPWGVDKEKNRAATETMEMLEDLKARRKVYDKDLPDNAKEIIDETIAKAEKGELDFKTLSSTLDRFADWEKLYKDSLKEASHAEH